MSQARTKYSNTARLLTVLPTIFVLVFVIVPVANIFGKTFRDVSLSLLRSSTIHEIIWFTTWQALVSTVIALALAAPVAFCVANFRFYGQRLVTSLTGIPFILPSIVVGVAFLGVLPSTLHRTAFALILAHAYFNFGFAARMIGNRWLQIHPYLDDAARTLGASPSRLFSTITLPILQRSILNTSLIVFTLCFTSYGVVRMLGGPSRSTIETEIFFRAMQLGDVSGALLLSVVQILIIGSLFVVSTRFGSRDSRRASAPTISRQRRIDSTAKRFVVGLASLGAIGFTTAPLLAILIRSLRTSAGFTLEGWRSVATSTDLWRGLSTSFVYALGTLAIAVLLAIFASTATVFDERTAAFISVLTSLPIVVSSVSIGLGVLVTFDTPPIDWRGSQLMLPLAHAMIALPLAVRMITPVLQSIPAPLRQASSVLGANTWQTWRNIDLPIVRRSLVSAAAISAAVSLGEFGASSFLVRQNNETLPILISRLLSRPGDILQTQAFALSMILVVFSVALIFLIDTFDDFTPTNRAASDA